MGISRREFMTSVTASGMALIMSRLAIAEEPSFAEREILPGRQRWNPAASGSGRVDAVPKVTGAKLYASDFRAADLPGWPQNTSHAMLIRAADATHVLTEIDLSRLTGASKPAVVVTAADLAQAGVRVPEFYAGDLLCPVGKTPLYLGQPVALLIFEDFDRFDQARLALRDQAVLKFGGETGPVKMPNYGQFRFTRVAGPTPDAPDIYSPSKNGWVSPGFFEKSGAPVWPRLPEPSHDQGSAQVTTLSLTINGKSYGPRDVRDELTMNDFLREYLGMTGTKFGCGAAQCLSCAIIIDEADGTSYTSPTCIVPATSFNGKSIRTVEGLAKNGELSALQKAFIEHFSFQCGYCTAGFLNESQVLLERLVKKPVARADLEKTIAEALDGHLCRCTGYIKYHEAVRAVILADPGRYLS